MGCAGVDPPAPGAFLGLPRVFLDTWILPHLFPQGHICVCCILSPGVLWTVNTYNSLRFLSLASSLSMLTSVGASYESLNIDHPPFRLTTRDLWVIPSYQCSLTSVLYVFSFQDTLYILGSFVL